MQKRMGMGKKFWKGMLCAGILSAMVFGMTGAAEEITGIEAVEEVQTETAGEISENWTYDRMDPDAFEGEWVEFYGIFDLYLPIIWNGEDISAQDLRDGIIFVIGDKETKMRLVIGYVREQQIAEYTDIRGYLSAVVENVKACQMNDLSATGAFYDSPYVWAIPDETYQGAYLFTLTFPEEQKGIADTITASFSAARS